MNVRIAISKGAVPMHYDHGAPDEEPWNELAAGLRMRAWAGVDHPNADLSAWLHYREAFAWADESRPRDLRAYGLMHHDVVEDEGGWPRMVLSRAGLDAAARGLTALPPEDQDAAAAHLADHFHALGLEAPWELAAGGAGVLASEALVKPMQSEHRARQSDPAQYARFARKELAPGVHAILGIKEGGGSEVQSVAFDAERFTPAQAKAWLEKHGFEAGSFEEAVAKVAKIVCVNEEKRLVLAIAMRPDAADTYGHAASAPEVMKAAHRFALAGGFSSRQNVNHECAGCEHSATVHTEGSARALAGTLCGAEGCTCAGYEPAERDVYVVESATAPLGFTAWDGAKLTEPVQAGDWYVVLKVLDDAVWAMRGEFTGVSIEGTGTRTRGPAAAGTGAAPAA